MSQKKQQTHSPRRGRLAFRFYVSIDGINPSSPSSWIPPHERRSLTPLSASCYKSAPFEEPLKTKWCQSVQRWTLKINSADTFKVKPPYKKKKKERRDSSGTTEGCIYSTDVLWHTQSKKVVSDELKNTVLSVLDCTFNQVIKGLTLHLWKKRSIFEDSVLFFFSEPRRTSGHKPCINWLCGITVDECYSVT